MLREWKAKRGFIDMVFTSIGYLTNKEMLKGCHEKIDGSKAVGIG